ncbi:hypothetical protein [Streptomyces sp. NPDC001020]
MFPTHDQLIDQLAQSVMVRLIDPLEILFEGGTAVDAVRSQVRDRAAQWARQMLDEDDRAAIATIMRLMSTLYPGNGDALFEPPLDWWRTPMGQVVAWRTGHPTAESVSYPVAGAMLGITRQGVHDLVTRGKLARHPQGGVVPRSIRDRLQQKGRLNHA